MAFGLGMLGLAPSVFWMMTPRELDAALAGRLGRVASSGPTRRDLVRLMRAFPDQELTQ